MGIIRLLVLVGAILTPIFAILQTNGSATCGNHTCRDPLIGEANSHYKKYGCFCDALCDVYNDCCRDHKTKTLPGFETPTVECRYPTRYNDPVMMIVSCPAGFKGNQTIVDKCKNNSADLFSSIPVSGRKKQLVYRNAYCALCNGENSYTFWNQKLSCPTIQSAINFTINQINYTNCFSSFKNPYPNTSHLCIESLVKSCRNSSVGKCETESNGVVYSNTGTFYKNSHCFQCNRRAEETLICGDLPNEKELATPLTYSSPSYFILINFNRRDVRLNGNTRIAKCPEGHWFDYAKRKCQRGLDIGNSPTNASTDTKVLNCSLLILQKHEYTLLPNETLYRNSTKTFFDKDSYTINNSEVFVCDDHERTESILETWLTFVGTVISLTALTLLVVIYLFMPTIWNLTGMIYVSYSLALFLAQTMFLVSRYAGSHDSCLSIAVTMHYAFLVSFLWLNVISVNIWLTVCRNPCEMTSKRGMKRFFLYSLYAWLTPLAIIIPALLLDKHRPDSKFAPRYGYNGDCWINNNNSLILFFAVPLAALILVNLLAYVHTAVTIYHLRKFAVQNSGKGNIKILIINTKLCFLTGITWVFGYLASALESKELQIIFIILNTTYGLWLAICFLTSENIFSSMKQKFRSVSQSTSTKTMS